MQYGWCCDWREVFSAEGRCYAVFACLRHILLFALPFVEKHIVLQRLSIAGCTAAVLGGPIMVFGTADSMPLAAQLSICVTVGGFGIFTTSR